uniref:hypothetical protein n=1 Tax=Segatella copri TaxID=165179 RepID=UPI003FEFA2F9
MEKKIPQKRIFQQSPQTQNLQTSLMRSQPPLTRSSARRISSRRRRAPRAYRPARATNLGEEDKRQTEENC